VFHAWPRLAPGGYIGVDVFFVISGFLITSILLRGLHRGTFSFTEFYVRRARRILPALVVVLPSTWVLGWLALDPEQLAALGRQIAGGAGFVSNLVMWAEAGYFDEEAALKSFLHLWSLGIEEQFYLVWPLCLAVCWIARVPVPVLLGTAFALSFSLNVAWVSRHPVAIFYSPFSRFWELLAGAVLAHLTLSHQQRFVRVQTRMVLSRGGMTLGLSDVALVCGLLLILFPVWILHGASEFHGLAALFPVGGAALLIAFGGQGVLGRTLLGNRLMVSIRLISYPLYLWH
jgi:peptidoglycan/LPS O-acetylase OafA/YrhL